MCTRYYIEMSPELRPYIEAADRSPLKNRMIRILGKPFKAEGEIRPTDMATVIAFSADRSLAAFPMVWGYHIEGINHPVVNARLESAKDKRSFSEDWKRHRCIVPATCYFEWQHVRKPDGKIVRGDKFAIRPQQSSQTWLAGLYRIEQTGGLRYPVFTILTRTPSPELLQIHDRMPLILPGSSIQSWIDPDIPPEETARKALTDMVFEKALHKQGR